MLDATVGSITANSYVTVEEADSYFEDRFHSEKWDAVTRKEAILVTASKMIDWQLVFQGSKSSGLQAMQFPRTGVILRDGTTVSSTIIPNEVKYATFEMALSFISSDRTADSALSGIQEAKVGPLFVKASQGGYKDTSPKLIPDYVRKILIEFISSGMSVVFLERM